MINKIVAITGQSGSGKSTVSKHYTNKGYSVVDSDEIAKTVHNNKDCIKELVKAFGDDIIKNDILDKSLLSKKAFETKESLQKLTDVTHPFIIESILTAIKEYQNSGSNIVFVDGAVIIGHEFEKYCDKFIVVVSSMDTQINRIIKRDNISSEKAVARIKKQSSNEELLKKADYVIENNSSLEDLLNQSDCILNKVTN